jgi:hypothetical protein
LIASYWPSKLNNLLRNLGIYYGSIRRKLTDFASNAVSQHRSPSPLRMLSHVPAPFPIYQSCFILSFGSAAPKLSTLHNYSPNGTPPPKYILQSLNAHFSCDMARRRSLPKRNNPPWAFVFSASLNILLFFY